MNKRMIGIIGALLSIPLVLGLALWSSQATAAPAQAQTDTEAVPESETERMIHVSGSGQVSATPDMAVVRLGVETQAETAVDAMGQNNMRMADVISATLEAGVLQDDIQTQGIRLQPVYEQDPEGGQRQNLVGYRASNIVEITARDLDGLGTTLDAAIGAGGNTIQGIRFEISNRDELLIAAREAAMNDAISKAEQLTGLAGAELGEVITIRESGGGGPGPVRVESAAVGGAVPVSPGTQSVEANVQVTWRIQ